jgi:hypothetical protein
LRVNLGDPGKVEAGQRRAVRVLRGFGDALTATPIKEIERWWRPLSLERLRTLLHAGEPLPKDGFLETDVGGLHSNPYRNRDRNFERAVLHAMTSPAASPNQHELALQIANCTREDRCDRLHCYICTQIYWRKRRALLEAIAVGPGDGAVSWCTVIIGQSQVGYPVIKEMIADFKTTFINALARFQQVKWSGRIEIDYIDKSVCPPTPVKLITLLAMNWDNSSEMATLVPHAHLVLVHPDVRRETLAYHLKRTFPESRRVQVRPFRITKERAATLDNLVRYPLKRPLERPFLAGRNSNNHIPRHPAVVRYVVRMRESLDRPSQRWRLEFDRL